MEQVLSKYLRSTFVNLFLKYFPGKGCILSAVTCTIRCFHRWAWWRHPSFSICVLNASVWGDGEGLTLPDSVSLGVQCQASSRSSSGSKHYPPFSTLLFAPENWLLWTAWVVSLPLVSSWVQQGEGPRLEGGREWVRMLLPCGVSHIGSSSSRMVTAPVRHPVLSTSVSVPVQVPILSSCPFRPWGGTEPALPDSLSFLAQGTTLGLVAFLHPAHFFVNCPFIKFPSNYHTLRMPPVSCWYPDSLRVYMLTS